MTCPAQPPPPATEPSRRSLGGLDWLNFNVAAMQAGFGALVAVRLTQAGWPQGDIGAVLSASTIAAMLAQLPSGVVIDRFAGKQAMAGAAILASMSALVLLATTTSFLFVLGAEVVQGAAGVGLALAIAAISLSVARQERLGERFGGNVRFANFGGAFGALAAGFAGQLVSPPAVFLLAAGFGPLALWSLWRIGADELAAAHLRTTHLAALLPQLRPAEPAPASRVLRDPRLLALMAGVALFQLGNAALLPLAGAVLAQRTGSNASVLTAVAVILPQIFSAVLSPRVGALAQRIGRRPLLLAGLAALPLRALAFALVTRPEPMLVVQLLDGISSAAIGVLVPLIVADITHRGGRFNLALGSLGLASAAGATVSTFVAGTIADRAGLPTAFLALAAAGSLAMLVVSLKLPETAHLPVSEERP
jgi:MFS family permease